VHPVGADVAVGVSHILRGGLHLPPGLVAVRILGVFAAVPYCPKLIRLSRVGAVIAQVATGTIISHQACSHGVGPIQWSTVNP